MSITTSVLTDEYIQTAVQHELAWTPDVDNLIVHPKNRWTITDTDLGKEVERALKRASNVPETSKQRSNSTP